MTQVETTPNHDETFWTEFLDHYDREYPLVHVADIPSPLMYPEESHPILSLLADHDITWCSCGSRSHSLLVSKNRVGEAQRLIGESFPDIRLVPIASVKKAVKLN